MRNFSSTCSNNWIFQWFLNDHNRIFSILWWKATHYKSLTFYLIVLFMSLPCLEWNNYIYYFEDGNIVNVFQYLVIFVTKVISISRKLLHSVEKQKNFFVVLSQLMIFMQLQNSTCKSFKISHLVIINPLNVNRLIITFWLAIMIPFVWHYLK